MKNFIASTLFPRIQAQGLGFEVMYALFRFYCGISMAYGAGLAKVFHKIDEAGGMQWSNLEFGAPTWFVEQVQGIGFTFISPSFWAYLAIYGEFLGGLLIAIGFLTRISAIQMAFQFFVVAFIWYESPMPFAMYYQQLIFWSFALIAVVGSGRFSVDNWLQNRSPKSNLQSNSLAFIACLLFFGASDAVGQEVQNVPFVVKNGGTKAKSIEMKHFNDQTRKTIGYGLDLAGNEKEAVNLPTGTRIYLVTQGKQELIAVIKPNDAGATFDISRPRELQREDYLAAANDELSEQSAEKTAPNTTIETLANQYQVPLIPLIFKGKTLFPKLVHVRVELPFEGANPNSGFSEHLSLRAQKYVAWPIGSKVYLCEQPFWQAGSEGKERLLFVVDSEKANYTFSL
jgi:uncharacterized membrane protein YphA (DoxX/SURF4 family)